MTYEQVKRTLGELMERSDEVAQLYRGHTVLDAAKEAYDRGFLGGEEVSHFGPEPKLNPFGDYEQTYMTLSGPIEDGTIELMMPDGAGLRIFRFTRDQALEAGLLLIEAAGCCDRSPIGERK